MFMNTLPINDAAVAAIEAMQASNNAETQMGLDYAEAVAAIKKFNSSREAFIVARAAAVSALGDNATASENMIADHAGDLVPTKLPDPTDEPLPTPPVAEAALNFRRRSA